MAEPRGEQLRCFCSRKPLLAIVGSDKKTGDAWVHIKVFRQEKIYAEVVVSAKDGCVRIRCRECLRWFVLNIRSEKLEVKEEPLPEGLILAKR